jgi:hypothetical protein
MRCRRDDHLSVVGRNGDVPLYVAPCGAGGANLELRDRALVPIVGDRHTHGPVSRTRLETR